MAIRKKAASAIRDDLRERVARACRVLGGLDLTLAGQGHVSARLPGKDAMLIRARGPGEKGVRYTSEKEVIEIDFSGQVTAGARAGIASPTEIFIHTEIYKQRPDIHSVIHIHPPTVVLFTICNKPLLPLYGAYDPPSMKIAVDGVPLYDRSILIRTPQLGQEVAALMGTGQLCLMRGHGITSAHNSIEEAALNAIFLNELAEMNYRAHLLGNARPITEEDQKELAGMAVRGVGAPGEPAPWAAASWRYYVALTKA